MSFSNISSRYGVPEGNEGEPLLADQDTKHELVIPVEQDVYSAILFLPSISRITTGSENSRNARLAFLLCVMNAVMQIGVVQVINVYNHAGRREDTQILLARDDVTHGNMKDKYQDQHVSNLEKIHVWLLPEHEREQFEETSLIKPLCARVRDTEDTGDFSCMPQSVEFIQEWRNLDSDGDGLWSFQEAKNDTAGLAAKYGVTPETIFNNAIDGFRMHAMDSLLSNHTFYLSQFVKDGSAIPKAYFNYWSGDAMLCSLFDPSSCEVAAQHGFFAEALRPGRVSAASKGIYDLDTALQYCHKMLKRSGGCETVLPLNWKRSRDQRRDKCGRRELVDDGTRYANPYATDQFVNVLKRRFQRVELAEDSSSPLFLIFLTLIVVLWLLSVIGEWRYLLKKAEFLLVFPGVDENGKTGHMYASTPGEGDPEEPTTSYHITGISRPHRAVLIIVFALRFAVVVVLTQFGVVFLLVEQSYLNLVLNSLALTFILSIDNMLYDMVESQTKRDMENCRDLVFVSRIPSGGYLGYALKKECWGMFLVPILSVLIVARFAYQYKFPILAALQCACNQEGPQCVDAMQNQIAWWNAYWSRTLPQAMHQIEAMRLSGA